MTHHVLVLGAGYAGLAAARRAALRLRRVDAKVTLVNAVDRFIERIRLHQLAAGQRLRDLPLAALLDGTDVDLRIACVVGIDPADQVVRLDAPPYTLPYDTLVYALGSETDVGGVPGAAEHACTVAEAGAALRLRSRAARAAAAGGALTVVGGGLTGIEVAAELAEAHRGLRVHLLTGAELGGGLCTLAREHLRRTLSRLGVAVQEGVRVIGVDERALHLVDGSTFDSDVIVWAAGFRVSAIAADASFAVDPSGRILIDDTLRSNSHPRVYAVGDAAVTRVAGGIEARMSCQTGLPMGLWVADLIAARLTGRRPVPVRLRHVWQNISLGRRDAVTQFTHADDSPRRGLLTGRAAALFKETISRGAVQVIRHPGVYPPRSPQLPTPTKRRPGRRESPWAA